MERVVINCVSRSRFWKPLLEGPTSLLVLEQRKLPHWGDCINGGGIAIELPPRCRPWRERRDALPL